MYEELIESLIENEPMCLPIESVSGIKCNVFIRKYTWNEIKRIVLKIKSHKTEYNPHGEDIEHEYWSDSESIENIGKLFETLGKLKYDRLHCRFTVKPQINWSFLEKIETVKMAYDMCCVCHEQTLHKTKCEHTCCADCIDQLKPTPDEDDEDETHILCPVCRTDLERY